MTSRSPHTPVLAALAVGYGLLTAGLALSPSAAVAEDSPPSWNQWRGPARDGRVEGPAWPGSLDGLERSWRVELGKGYPGPVVAADRVFVVESDREGAAVVRALARATGETLWRRSWPARAEVPFFAASHGAWVRSTPAWDGETLYVGDMLEVLVAFDGASGEERWRVDFKARYGTRAPDFGFASSPLLAGDHLYVQAANSLVKLDRATGESVWRAAVADGDMMDSGAFSSPVMAEIAGREQVVVFTRRALAGVDPESGAVLWSTEVPNFRGMNIVTPTVWEDTVFVSQHRNGSHLVRVAESAGELAATTAWSQKASGYMSSPVVIAGHAYQHLGNGRLTCIDLATGEERWRTTPLGDYWSLVHQGDRILALDSEGTLRLLRADASAFTPLDEREVAGASTWGHLAVSGDELFVRELEAVSAWRWPAGPAAAVAAP
ncbi:MAG: PQQ-binding-like beta-propeller repeat protein [Thermoleophilia bacterium]|nr:PQQ-binding-like beta-propeller repeat protein [Thermoleophilia bacterium]